MEYYVYVTDSCNLACTFCCNLQKRTEKAKPAACQETVDFVLRDIEKWGHQNNSVIFYGGEPLLNQEYIKNFIKKINNGKISFLCFTNGTLLNGIDPFLLKNLKVLFVSIDGEHRVHDKFRGKGTFKKVIQNLFSVKSDFSGVTVARLCFVPGNSLYSSVLGVVNWFDNVHWQLENSPSRLENQEACLDCYSKELDLLIDFWMNHLREGIVKNIIPFQAIVSSFLFERKSPSFRCGAGSRLTAIGTNGDCFVCDDLIGNEEFCIGSIKEGTNHEMLNKFGRNISCSGCGINDICGGRCLRAWKEFPEKTEFYCSATKLLVSKLKEKIPEIKKLAEAGIISKQELDNPISRFTEQIP